VRSSRHPERDMDNGVAFRRFFERSVSQFTFATQAVP
jgi:hypothetical protein